MNVDDSFYKLEGNKYIYNKTKKYYTAFILDGQRDTYLFPFDGNYGTIIDFSDSVLGRDFLKFTDQFVRFTNFETIIEREKESIFNRLSSILTYVKKYKDKVRGAIMSNYDTMFKAITGIDYVYITRNIRILLEREMPKDAVSSDVLRRIEEMENVSLEYLLSSVQNVVDGEGKCVDYVGDALIPKFFKKYKYHNRPKDINVREIYNFDNKWNHSCVEFARYPDWAKEGVVEKKFGKNVADELFTQGTIPPNVERDTHLAFLIERLNAEYGTSVIQTAKTGTENNLEEFS